MEVDDERNQQQNSNENTLQNPDSPHSTDSSDSDDDSQQTLQLNALQTDLSNNPSNYDAHVQYIKLLRKMGEVDKLREAREAMSVVFPLTPKMWQDWAKDEASLSTRPEEFSAVEKLYERGVFDYLSVPLWCDYLNYIQEIDPSVRECSPDGISKARNLFEHALAAAGLHFTEGSKIWEAYREFEQAILLTIDVTDAKGKELEVQRIRSIFHRQLSVPLDDLKSTLLAYKAWEVEQGNSLDAESSDVDGLSSHIASAYQKAMEMYDARVFYEEQISGQDISDTEKFQNFMTYLRFEKSAGDPVRIQVLYERAITEFPVSSDLWLDYVHYLDRTLKVGKVIKDVYSRAIKNCSWVGEIWVRYLLSLERSRDSEEAISAVFEKSLQCTFSSFDEYMDLYLTRIDGLRRRVLFGNEAEGVLDFSCIRKTFQHASDYLCPLLKATEGLLHLHAYWARLELILGKDLAAAREVWESFLRNSGSMLEAWRRYIEMEIQLGNITEARSIYRRCYSRRFAETGSEDICHSWLRFEREFGTLEDFDRAVQKVSPRLEELKLYRIQEESKALAGADQKENPSKKNVREKRKGGAVVGDEQSPAKRQKQTPQIPKKIYEKDKDTTQSLAEVNEAEEVREKMEKESATDDKQMKISNTGRSKIYTDQCTAFVSNLNLKATDEDLHKFFSDVGGVVSVRILHDRFTGKSRGLAYVDFSDDEHLAAAVTKNKQMLLGKKVSVARSDPKQHKKDGRRGQKDQAQMSDQSRNNGSFRSMESGISASGAHRRDAVQLTGKNTFAMPRNVRPLGMKADKPTTAEEGDEKAKSNEEFRKMFIKS